MSSKIAFKVLASEVLKNAFNEDPRREFTFCQLAGECWHYLIELGFRHNGDITGDMIRKNLSHIEEYLLDQGLRIARRMKNGREIFSIKIADELDEDLLIQSHGKDRDRAQSIVNKTNKKLKVERDLNMFLEGAKQLQLIET